ncbi:cytochrome P450 [Lineolata rhizophorae]|uniref:Cytochrome P450 n=1 Tax=Lineolata rhizophorae TaxID=578093 RepID=A0A6A6NVQ6_9PEZI|nr:cytochrome P450 [Lineolata rhizophorae]
MAPGLLAPLDDAFRGEKPVGLWALSAGAVLLCAYLLGVAVYRLCFHPLARYPGPKLSAVSSIPFALSLMRGDAAHDALWLHEKYGDVVRITPNQLSFTHPDAWQDIYNYKLDRPHFVKELTGYPESISKIPSIQIADDARWSIHRRLLAHGFSEKALREHRLPLLESYTQKLLESLRRHVSGPSQGKVDIGRLLNFTTFDLTADLTFGKSLQCLERNDYNPWVALVFDSVKAAISLNAIRMFPTFNAILVRMMPKSLMQKAVDHFNLCVQWTNQRLESKSERPDFVLLLQKPVGGKELSKGELYADVPILLLGGSETSATVLTACIHYLCKNPRVQTKLRDELLASVPSKEDITLQNVAKIDYMTAVLWETMRIFVAVPGYLPRVSPKGGAYVAGNFVPENMTVSTFGWAMTHSKRNFREPYTFAPERWVEGDTTWTSDRKGALQPFSVGPRNCVGKNLAWAEMRIILAQLLWNFNFELCEDSQDWSEQRKTYILWANHSMNVKLSPRLEKGNA